MTNLKTDKVKFIEMRTKCIKFIEKIIKEKWGKHMAIDIVDCLLLNYFLPYKEQAISKLSKEYISIKDVEKIIDDTYKNLDMGKTIPIFIQRLKESIKEGK